MTKTKFLGAGAALALVMTLVVALVIPGSAFAQAAAGAMAPTTTTFEYRGPPLLHMPGAMDPMTGRPVYHDMRDPQVVQSLVARGGVASLQELLDTSLQECSDIGVLETMIAQYEASTQQYAAEGEKLRKDLPRHQFVQGAMTIGDAGSSIAVGAETGGPVGLAYGIGGLFRLGKQFSSDRWQGRLDRHFINGTDLQVQGVKVHTYSTRIYARHMATYCPLLANYVRAYGQTISVRAVSTATATATQSQATSTAQSVTWTE